MCVLPIEYIQSLYTNLIVRFMDVGNIWTLNCRVHIFPTSMICTIRLKSKGRKEWNSAITDICYQYGWIVANCMNRKAAVMYYSVKMAKFSVHNIIYTYAKKLPRWPLRDSPPRPRVHTPRLESHLVSGPYTS